MFIKSILESNKLEIISSKRSTSFLYLLFGLSTVVWWCAVTIQFLNAYFDLGEFDVTVGEFIFIALLFFLPLLLIGSFMLATVLQRLRLWYWFKNRISIAEYDAMYHPAVAGTIIDFEYNLNEVWATLLNLHIRGEIVLIAEDTGIYAQRLSTKTLLSEYELVLLDSLGIRGNHEAIFHAIDEYDLVHAGENAHRIIVRDLIRMGLVRQKLSKNIVLTKIIKAVYWIGGLAALSQVATILFAYDQASTVLYPRYPVHPAQLVVILLMWVVMMIVLLSGFWPRFNHSSKSTESTMHLKAVGYYYFLDQVYKNRMSIYHVEKMDKSTIAMTVPHMIAYGIIDVSEDYVSKIIRRLSS